MLAIQNGPVMEYRTRDATSVADMAHDLPLQDPVSRLDAKIPHVEVFRQESSAVINDDHVSVIVKPACQNHCSVIGSPNRGSLRRINVLPHVTGHGLPVQNADSPEIMGHPPRQRKPERTKKSDGRPAFKNRVDLAIFLADSEQKGSGWRNISGPDMQS